MVSPTGREGIDERHPLAAPSFTSGAAMTHHRNFYFEKVSSRTTLGGNTPPGPHYAHEQRDSKILLFPRAILPPGAMENLPDGAETVRSFIPEYELGAIVLVFSVLLAPALFVFALIFFGIALFDFG